jgi:hypothetical protein
MDCLDFFKINASNADKCKLLQDNPQQALDWELACSASEYSPGRVQDCEILHRQIFHPIHLDDETGKLKPAAFDDASNKGLSVTTGLNSYPPISLLRRAWAKPLKIGKENQTVDFLD